MKERLENHLMEKIRDFCSTKKFSRLLIAVGTVLILFYYGKNLPAIRMVWQLLDEYGYLANAAYLSDTDWSFMGNQYYGYGYSLWLIPLFWFCSTGTQLIRGAVAFNTLCVVGIFWAQIFLISRIFPKLNRNIIIICSFVLCFYPYLAAADMVVVCECLLTLTVWLCGCFFYQALQTGRWYYYLLLAIGAGYAFFIHTRSIVFVAVLCLAVVVSAVTGRAGWKRIAAFVVPFIGILVVGYALKNRIIDAVYSNVLFAEASAGDGAADASVTIVNTITIEFLWNRIANVFSNITAYVYSFFCKNFYLLAATGGMFHIGFVAAVKSVREEWKRDRQLTAGNAVMFMYAIAAFLMVLAVTVNSPGSFEQPAYFFYGRYFEYAIAPVMFKGLIHCMQRKLRGRDIAALILGVLVSGGVTIGLSGKVVAETFWYDTFRMAAFTFVASWGITYFRVILYCMITALTAIGIIIVCNRWKKGAALIPLVLLVIFLLNDGAVVKRTIAYSQIDPNYLDVSYYIHQNYDVDEVYFLNGDDIYLTAYTGIQCMLGKEKLIVIQEKDLDQVSSGDLVVTFCNNPYVEEWDAQKTKVLTAGTFEIYEVH